MKNQLIWCVVFASCISVQSAIAVSTNRVDRVSSKNEDTKKDAEVSEIVISASRFEEEAWKSGSSVSVVPEGKIKLQRPLETVEPFRGEPGIEIMRGEPGTAVNNATGVPGGTSQISIRGLPFNRTLVKVDGLRFNRPIDNIANMTDLPPLLLGDIEILRGPQSSLYGSEAEGGVVSAYAPKGKGKPDFGSSFELGTFNTRRERISTQGSEKLFDWNFAYSRLDTDNERPNSTFRQDGMATRLGYNLNSYARVDFMSRWSDYTVGSPGPTSGFGANDPDNRLMRRMFLVTPTLTVDVTRNWQSKLQVGSIEVGQRFSSPPNTGFGSEFVNHSTSEQLHWENIVDVTDWNVLVGGLESRKEYTTTEADSGNQAFTRSTDSVYLSDSIRWEDWWGFTLSGRYDQNEGFRDAFTYRASQVFRIPIESNLLPIDPMFVPTEARIHMSFGTGFRAPSISELQPLFGPFSGNNVNLVPETTEGYDIGVTYPFLDGKLEADATYFYNNVVNLITTDGAFVFQNISEARSEGLETSLKWKILKDLSLRGAFSLYATTSKDFRFSGNDLPRIPRESGSLAAIWEPVEKIHTAFQWTYKGTTFDDAANTRELRDFNRIDAFADFDVTSYLKVFARAENLLGYRYQEAANFPALGRTFYGGAEVKF